MANTQYFVCLSLLFSGTFAFPAADYLLSKQNFTSPSGNEIFWFPNDQGELVPAFLKGGPPQASLDAIEDDVEFWLYKNGANPGVLIQPNCANCLGTYVSGAPLIIIAHGFSGDHTGFSNYRSAISTLSGSHNVVLINWGKLAAAPWYETAANNVEPVGLYTARLINFLIQRGLTSVNLVHFVGHSLGSHVGNYAGKGITGGKIGRITALDPALPLFGERGDSQRIDPTDATFVDVLHTAMGTLLDGGLAFTEPRGHVDFYPNSGKNQPGCGVDAFGACSHGRANDYFVESIRNQRAFHACKCNNWDEYSSGRCLCTNQEYMGWSTPSSTRALYYLRTNANSPYGQG